MADHPQGLLAGRYQLGEIIGTGGLANAYLARDLLDGGEVALKMIRSQADEALLRQEFALLRGCQHRHLVRVRDFGFASTQEGKHAFYVAERVNGVPFLDFVADEPWTTCVEPLVQVLHALHYLHERGIRHGDIKSENILISEDGNATLIDLSCASMLEHRVSLVAGTPTHMAPEIRLGSRVDRRADLYSLGVMLQNIHARMPTALRAIVSELIATDPDQRASDVPTILEALDLKHRLSEYVRVQSRHLLEREQGLNAFRSAFAALQSAKTTARIVRFVGPAKSGRTRLLEELKWEAQTLTPHVTEARGRHAGAIDDLLRRATNEHELSSGLQGVSNALEHLSKTSAHVLIIDDADQLSSAQRALLEALIEGVAQQANVLLLMACTTAGFESNPYATSIALTPLSLHALEQWCEDVGRGREAAPQIMERTKGSPGFVAHELAGFFGQQDRQEFPQQRWNTLSPTLRTAFAHLSAWREPIPHWFRMATNIPAHIWSEGVSQGLFLQDGSALRLAYEDWYPSIEALLDEKRLNAVRAMQLRILENENHRDAPRELRLILAMKRNEEALKFLESHQNVPASRTWAKAIRDLAMHLSSNPLRCRAGTMFLELGLFEDALQLMAQETTPWTESDQLARILIQTRTYLRQGDHETAQTTRDGIPDDATIPNALRAEMCEIDARLALRQSQYIDATRLANEGLSCAVEGRQIARLKEILGLCASFLGDEHATQLLRDAQRAHAVCKDAPGQLRAVSYLAIDAHRRADWKSAAKGYREALQIAEHHHIDNQLATAWLNLGTAIQELGNWGEAIKAYERGLRFAILSRRKRTELLLYYNLANLYTEIGLFERAEHLLKETQQRLVANPDKSALRRATLQLQGEIAAGRNRPAEARKAFQAATEAFERVGALRELTECRLLLAQHNLATDETNAAETELHGILQLLREVEAIDLSIRALLLRSQIAIRRQDYAEAQALIEEAAQDADHHQLTRIQAEVDSMWGVLYDHLQAPELARDHRRAARARWSKISATLIPSLRNAFRKHPKRRKAFADTEHISPDTIPSNDVRKLERFLAINRRLNSSLDTKRVLEAAMDAAIELTNAERGFVLLTAEQPGSRFRVAASRNLDREQVPRSHLQFSRSIAQKVMASEQSVVTIDAQSDDRFREERSVHAMQLQSVACVPIRSPQGVLGALYLDNRFEQGRFIDDDLSLLNAFADQVAMALQNAQLHADLAKRERELNKARKELEKRVEGQANQIGELEAQVKRRQEALEFRYNYDRIIGRSPKMRAVLSKLDRLIDSPLTVLIHGESGTGKELIAKAVHYNSPRKDQRLVSLNCAALPATLIESELFGHRKGAFTGADQDRDGLLVQADGGSIFLDEIGEMPLTLQAKLLRALQEREVMPLGADAPVTIDTRFLCATNRNLKAEVDAGRFREDLYYRVTVVEIELPPLRERPQDIPDLIAEFLRQAGEKRPLTRNAYRALMAHRWPGNIRELQNTIARSCIFASGPTIGLKDLSLPSTPKSVPGQAQDRDSFQTQESSTLRQALELRGWNVSRVSRELGIPRQTLYRKLKKYGLIKPQKRPPKP